MEKMLQRAGIEYHDGKDLKGQIVEKGIEAEIIDIMWRPGKKSSIYKYLFFCIKSNHVLLSCTSLFLGNASSLIPQQQTKLCLRMQMQMVHIVLL